MESAIHVNGRTIHGEKVGFELAWPIEETPGILTELAAQGRIILGGDMLDHEQNHLGCNWYYNPSQKLPQSENIQRSLDTALPYIHKFIERNGTQYYVIIVTEP